MSNAASRDEVFGKVKGFIFEILSASNKELKLEDVANDLSELTFTSIDYLEFVLKVENEFNIDIPDEMLVERQNNTIQHWADFIHQEIAAQ